jgi:hypothetical protein
MDLEGELAGIRDGARPPPPSASRSRRRRPGPSESSGMRSKPSTELRRARPAAQGRPPTSRSSWLPRRCAARCSADQDRLLDEFVAAIERGPVDAARPGQDG